jgi:hypothetical protein
VIALRVTQLAHVSSARLFLRSDLTYFVDESNCSHKYVEPKNENMANAIFSVLQNNLARFCTHFKLDFLCLYHFLCVDHAPVLPAVFSAQ